MKRLLGYRDFLLESEETDIGLVIGSYRRMKDDVIGISTIKFNEGEEFQAPGISITIDEDKKSCKLSYKTDEGEEQIEIPNSSIKFPGEIETPEEISILMDSRWAGIDKNGKEIYEFVENYISEYYKSIKKSSENLEEAEEDNISLLLSEIGCEILPVDFSIINEKKITFSDDEERFYKILKGNGENINGLEISETRSSKDPYFKLRFNKFYECEIRSNGEIYTLYKEKMNELKENLIFSNSVSRKELGSIKNAETKLKELLKEEIDLNKTNRSKKSENNISFISEELKLFCSDEEIYNFIKNSSL